MSDSMIERVAAVIRQTAQLIVDDEDGPFLDNPHELARAAIEAMREPTEAMLSAGSRGFAIGDLPLPGEVWERMIDALLAEAPA